MKSSAAIAEKVNIGLSRRKNGGRVAVAKSAPLPKVDIDERQYLFFFADPQTIPAPLPRSSHRWGNRTVGDKSAEPQLHDFLLCRGRLLTAFTIHKCTCCNLVRFCAEHTCEKKWMNPSVVWVIYSSKDGYTRTRPPCAGFLK